MYPHNIKEEPPPPCYLSWGVPLGLLQATFSSGQDINRTWLGGTLQSPGHYLDRIWTTSAYPTARQVLDHARRHPFGQTDTCQNMTFQQPSEKRLVLKEKFTTQIMFVAWSITFMTWWSVRAPSGIGCIGIVIGPIVVTHVGLPAITISETTADPGSSLLNDLQVVRNQKN